MNQNLLNKGQIIKIAQDSAVNEYSINEKTLYYKTKLNKPALAIYLRPFSEYNDKMCELILGDKIIYTSEDNLRPLRK